MKRICAKPLEYAGRQLGVGDEFECEEGDVAFLTDVGFIRREERNTYQTRDMVKRRKAA